MLLKKYQNGDQFKKLELPNSKTIPSETTNKAATAPKQAVQAKREVNYRNSPEYKAKKLKEEKDKKAAQIAFEKERWDKYNKSSLTDKIVDRTQAALTSPLLMASNLISGNQAYIPGMAHALTDPNHPDYGKYLKAVHQEEGTIEPNDFFNGINPFYQGVAIRKKADSGDYAGAGLDAALTILGAKTINPNAGAGAAKLLTKAGNNPVMRGYNNIATGNSFIPYAWKSPAVGKTEAGTRQLFDKVLNSKEITDAERAVLIDYQQNSRLYTGRADNLDPAKREIINNILKKHSLEEIKDNDVFLTRRIKASNKDVFPLEDNKLLLGDRPTSFTVGVGQRGHASASDRIVIPNKYTKALNENFIKQSYEPVSEETLDLMGKPKNTYETNVQEFAKFIHTNKNLKAEKEVIGKGLNLKKIGKVKNDIGGYDYIMKPIKQTQQKNISKAFSDVLNPAAGVSNSFIPMTSNPTLQNVEALFRNKSWLQKANNPSNKNVIDFTPKSNYDYKGLEKEINNHFIDQQNYLKTLTLDDVTDLGLDKKSLKDLQNVKLNIGNHEEGNFYDYDNNTVYINPVHAEKLVELGFAPSVKSLISHEIGHAFRTHALDNQAKSLNIQPEAYKKLFGAKNLNLDDDQLAYIVEKSNTPKTEIYPHIRESKQNYINYGVIKSMKDPVSELDVLKYVGDNMSRGGLSVDNDRLHKFLDYNKVDNYKKLASLLSSVKGVAPIGLTGGAAATLLNNPYKKESPVKFRNGGVLYKNR
jgi:hypothetical protein